MSTSDNGNMTTTNATGTGPGGQLERDDRGLYDPDPLDFDLVFARTGVPMEALANNPDDDKPATPAHDAETGEVETWDGFEDGQIRTYSGADWAGEKLLEARRAIRENTEAVEASIARLKERLATLNAPLRRREDFFRAALEEYARREGRKTLCVGKAHSRELPSGVRMVWTVRKEGSYRWDQKLEGSLRKTMLAVWALGMEDRARSLEQPIPPLTESVVWPVLEEIKKYLAETPARDEANNPTGPAEAPPGLEYVPPGETFEVKVPDKEST